MRNNDLPYQIRRSSRAKLARIVVSPEKIEVVAPRNLSAQQIALFVSAKQAWIEAALEKVRLRMQAIIPLAPHDYSHCALVPYQGKHYPLHITIKHSKHLTVEFNDAFFIQMPHTITATEQNTHIALALSVWMKKTLKSKITPIIQQHGQRLQLYPTVVRVKTQKSRWGSCSSTNAININWLLMLAPPVILEYVVVHELCHIREKNHSAAFWQLVALHLPDYQQHRLWLKQHGASLMQGLSCSPAPF